MGVTGNRLHAADQQDLHVYSIHSWVFVTLLTFANNAVDMTNINWPRPHK